MDRIRVLDEEGGGRLGKSLWITFDFCFEPFSGCFYVVKVFGLIPKLGTVKCMKVYNNKDEICDIVVLKEKIRLL